MITLSHCQLNGLLKVEGFRFYYGQSYLSCFTIFSPIFLTYQSASFNGSSTFMAKCSIFKLIFCFDLSVYYSLFIVQLWFGSATPFRLVVPGCLNFMEAKIMYLPIESISTSLEDRHKSKNFIDTAIYRGGVAVQDRHSGFLSGNRFWERHRGFEKVQKN